MSFSCIRLVTNENQQWCDARTAISNCKSASTKMNWNKCALQMNLLRKWQRFGVFFYALHTVTTINIRYNFVKDNKKQTCPFHLKPTRVAIHSWQRTRIHCFTWNKNVDGHNLSGAIHFSCSASVVLVDIDTIQQTVRISNIPSEWRNSTHPTWLPAKL